MSVLPCALLRAGYVPRHAAPREPLLPSSRSLLAAGLTAAVLPVGASPVLADPTAATGGPAAATGTVSTQVRPASPPAGTSTGSEGPGPASRTSAGSPASSGGSSSAATTGSPSSAASSGTLSSASGETATPAPARRPAERATTAVRLDVPDRDADGRMTVAVRLLADGDPVEDGLVRIERSTSSGWSYAGRLLTREDGLGWGTFRFSGTTTLRARYTGTPARTAVVTDAQRVVVEPPREFVPAAEVGTTSTLLRAAAAQIGKPYVYGATGPSAFDCSGFTRYVYAKIGKSLPRTSHAQERATRRVSRAEARPGDLVFIKDVRGHVGIYAGGGRMYDAPKPGSRITLRRIWTPNYVIGRVD